MATNTSLDLTRTVVVGTSSAGKTTLARRLAEELNAPHIELDALYWLPGWQGRDKDEFRRLVAERIAAERWVIDGNYIAVRDDVWRRATALVWLDYSLRVVFARALRRTVRRAVTREDLFSGNRESLWKGFCTWDGIPWWVLRTHCRRRREFPFLLARPEYGHLQVMTLRSPAEAERWMAGGYQAEAPARPFRAPEATGL